MPKCWFSSWPSWRRANLSSVSAPTLMTKVKYDFPSQVVHYSRRVGAHHQIRNSAAHKRASQQHSRAWAGPSRRAIDIRTNQGAVQCGALFALSPLSLFSLTSIILSLGRLLLHTIAQFRPSSFAVAFILLATYSPAGIAALFICLRRNQIL